MEASRTIWDMLSALGGGALMTVVVLLLTWILFITGRLKGGSFELGPLKIASASKDIQRLIKNHHDKMARIMMEFQKETAEVHAKKVNLNTLLNMWDYKDRINLQITHVSIGLQAVERELVDQFIEFLTTITETPCFNVYDKYGFRTYKLIASCAISHLMYTLYADIMSKDYKNNIWRSQIIKGFVAELYKKVNLYYCDYSDNPQPPQVIQFITERSLEIETLISNCLDGLIQIDEDYEQKIKTEKANFQILWDIYEDKWKDVYGILEKMDHEDL